MASWQSETHHPGHPHGAIQSHGAFCSRLTDASWLIDQILQCSRSSLLLLLPITQISRHSPTRTVTFKLIHNLPMVWRWGTLYVLTVPTLRLHPMRPVILAWDGLLLVVRISPNQSTEAIPPIRNFYPAPTLSQLLQMSRHGMCPSDPLLRLAKLKASVSVLILNCFNPNLALEVSPLMKEDQQQVDKLEMMRRCGLPNPSKRPNPEQRLRTRILLQLGKSAMREKWVLMSLVPARPSVR